MPLGAFEPTAPATVGTLERVWNPVSNGSGASPQTATLTLPRKGIWLVSVAVYLQGTLNNDALATWHVYWDGINCNVSEIMGTAHFGAGGMGANGLTLSNPVAGTGVVTATLTWTDAANHPTDWALNGLLLNAIKQLIGGPVI